MGLASVLLTLSRRGVFPSCADYAIGHFTNGFFCPLPARLTFWATDLIEGLSAQILSALFLHPFFFDLFFCFDTFDRFYII